jgi:hypothetical protein
MGLLAPGWLGGSPLSEVLNSMDNKVSVHCTDPPSEDEESPVVIAKVRYL